VRLTKHRIDMLHRVALAEVFTSPSAQPDYDGKKVLLDLLNAGLVVWENGSRLSDAGRKALQEKLSIRAWLQLEGMRARMGKIS
jgi:hypothetical protein